eukprot:1494730-Rhodomonas_salina.3
MRAGLAGHVAPVPAGSGFVHPIVQSYKAPSICCTLGTAVPLANKPKSGCVKQHLLHSSRPSVNLTPCRRGVRIHWPQCRGK